MRPQVLHLDIVVVIKRSFSVFWQWCFCRRFTIFCDAVGKIWVTISLPQNTLKNAGCDISFGCYVVVTLNGSFFNIRRFQVTTPSSIYSTQTMLLCPATRQTGCSDSWMQSLLRTFVQDWSLTPKRRKPFTSHRIRRCPQPFSSLEINFIKQSMYLGSIVTSTCKLTA